MDDYNEPALRLQKTLLNLRRERDKLSSEGKHEEASALAGSIARIETTLAQLPGAFKPETLQ
ncbi:hypothetical protein IRZ81_14665 [Pseudomonas putida]|uniref:hypothetical protein n=1 Tax=Pseudomonas TaxID=286 RepID=UPI0011A67E89|nr:MULTISPECIES: hypothetical protein [Pseudomonas]MBF8635941.1 hypothetical protein [Pseudomonas fulva]MBF8652037.1 hypothetical protein [Pseudomonas putida]MBF8655989.1 hypothetical protein [Pseudomonas putida]MBF8679915.1 hypothetical protein [Pseudomonas fulva]MBF8688206.1 hypothetical protein [Pseudomonas fulva]